MISPSSTSKTSPVRESRVLTFSFSPSGKPSSKATAHTPLPTLTFILGIVRTNRGLAGENNSFSFPRLTPAQVEINIFCPKSGNSFIWETSCGRSLGFTAIRITGQFFTTSSVSVTLKPSAKSFSLLSLLLTEIRKSSLVNSPDLRRPSAMALPMFPKPRKPIFPIG